MAITTSLDTLRHDINALLATYYSEQIKHARLVSPQYANLWQSMCELQSGGGKRLRPYLTVALYQALAGTEYAGVLFPAAAQELLHFGLLIHDDIIDRDYLRYGQKNIAAQYLAVYSEHADSQLSEHLALSTALLAGDLALTGAYHMCTQGSLTPQQKLQAVQYLDQGVFDVIGGELLDTQSVISSPEATDSFTIARYKTASYSFIAPMCTGAALAGAPDEVIGQLQHLGSVMGLAYQLVDDLLGLFGETAVTGKPVLSDLIEGKHTWPLQETLRRSGSSDRRKIMAVLKTPTSSQSQLEWVLGRVTITGARTATEEKIEAYYHQALALIATLPISPADQILLSSFVSDALHREY
ncbi:MAG: crtE [Candidatus Saccharibacteria bacterium]|nr:crtE [Candidatus Saccharibacteria bacterium]